LELFISFLFHLLLYLYVSCVLYLVKFLIDGFEIGFINGKRFLNYGSNQFKTRLRWLFVNNNKVRVGLDESQPTRTASRDARLIKINYFVIFIIFYVISLVYLPLVYCYFIIEHSSNFLDPIYYESSFFTNIFYYPNFHFDNNLLLATGIGNNKSVFKKIKNSITQNTIKAFMLQHSAYINYRFNKFLLGFDKGKWYALYAKNAGLSRLDAPTTISLS